MASLQAFGCYVPERVVTNAELAPLVGSEPDWIYNVSGIEERRFAAEQETVLDMGTAAANDCLRNAGVSADSVGFLLVSSITGERRFPGPAAEVAHRLGMTGTPALDIPLASAGSLMGLTLAADLVNRYGNVLVVAAEKMSSLVMQPPYDRGTAILFGDGAGACLVGTQPRGLLIRDSVLGSDGAFSSDLYAEAGGPISMSGRSVILQASRKVPKAIRDMLGRNRLKPDDAGTFLMHQANQNLLDRIAHALGVQAEKFFSNIRRYGNTSSASLLIAAAEWARQHQPEPGSHVVFAAFGAGFHWGAVLATATGP